MSFNDILEYSFLHFGDFHLSLYHLLAAAFVLGLARLLVIVTNRIVRQYFKRRKIDAGRQYAILQFIKYIIYTGAALIALEAMGIAISVIWGGAAALLVGIGLGLQQTFNDLLSGIILLIEGTVEIDDVVEVDGVVGRVTAIGIRTSRIETLNKISILIPNSKIAGEKATNWSHNEEPTRFQVKVGVAYSSDVNLVTQLLLQAAIEHPQVLRTPAPRVQFQDFGNSSLDFILHFYSFEYLQNEFVKSDLRYQITRLFREHQVEIPFPQRDLWLRNANPTELSLNT